jgi:N-acetylglucosamine-6-phosphate deacetylase
VTFAPELPGAAGLLQELGRRGVVAALGHSRADAAQVDASVTQGARHVTHLWNAMSGIHQRAPGLAGAALGDDRLSCDLICDGVHVDPRLVRVAARAKRERLLLITDRVSAGGGFGAGTLVDDGTALRLPDGRLAGSRLTLDRALRNAVSFGAMTQLEAVASVSLRPARLLGLERERGTLRPGARADLVLLDASGALAETWLAGERVYAAAPRSEAIPL